jgi:hypothetical protein
LQALEALESPGLHSLVFVVDGNNPRFTINMQSVLAKFNKHISSTAMSHALLVLTRVKGSEQPPRRIDEIIKMLGLPSKPSAGFFVSCSAFERNLDGLSPSESQSIQSEWKECYRELDNIVHRIAQVPQQAMLR